MEKQEKLNEIKRLYELAFSAGLIKNKSEFARMIGSPACNVSSAMCGNESYLTDALVARARAAIKNNGVDIIAEQSASICNNYGEQKNFGTQPDDLHYIVDNLREELREQRESYERIIATICGQNKQN